MKVFVIGITGGVGRRAAKQLATQGNQVDGLVRSVSKAETLAREGMSTTPGDLVAMSVEELADVIRGFDAIIFTAGAGGRDGPEATDQVDGDGPAKLASAANLAGVRRLVLVSVFPEAWRERRMDEDFEHYMVAKKRAETQLVLTDLDWVVLRPSALTNEPGTSRVDLGLAKVHEEISRDDVAATIVEVLRQPDVNRMILEVTGGSTLIEEAVAAMKPRHISYQSALMSTH